MTGCLQGGRSRAMKTTFGERGMEVRSREDCLGGTLPLVIVRSKVGRNSGLKQNRRPNVNSDSLQSHIEGYTEKLTKGKMAYLSISGVE